MPRFPPFAILILDGLLHRAGRLRDGDAAAGAAAARAAVGVEQADRVDRANATEQFRSLRALAQVDYAGPEGKHGFQEAVLVQRPDRLRLETLTFLGAILIVHGQR